MNDPRTTILNSPMSRLQIIAVAITVGLNALDGFDVVSISFAAPGIANEWGVQPAALGLVLSMGLIGMGFGSLLIAPLADVIGRRPLMLGCLVAMTIGMFLSATADNVYIMSIWRVITGLGIGGMLASITAVAAEFSNSRRKDLAVSIMTVGYPIGVVSGGLVAAWLLSNYDWRAVFIFGGIMSALFIPLILLFLPESISFLIQRDKPGSLDRVNRILTRMGHPTSTALPVLTKAERGSPLDIFSPGLRTTTFVLTGAYILHILTFYYMQTWIPRIVGPQGTNGLGMGFTQAQAAGVLVWANFGGVIGSTALGFFAGRFGLKRLTTMVTLGTAISVAAFGLVAPQLGTIQAMVFVAGFFWNATIVGLYSLAARNFPTHVRATGTGFMIGVGRAGAAIAPVLAGMLFQSGLSLSAVSPLMAVGSLLATVLLVVGLRHTANKEA